METNGNAKLCPKFCCEKCHYYTSKKSSFDNHLLSLKHNKETENMLNYICVKCNRTFNDRSGLWKHNKKCSIVTTTETTSETNSLTNAVLDLVKSNQELQQQMLEVCKTNSTNNVINTNTTNNVQTINNNSNNKSFNLNVFLNETCKDAMNMKDFVDSIQITLTDIENMGKLGFVNGISNIIVNRLKAIDVHLRPVHCTDQRRETMYVKEKNQWNKEEEDNKNIRRFIQLVAHKNTKNLNLFKNKHPDCLEYNSKYNDQYNKIVMETFGGYGNTDYDSENKIIRKLVKELAIDKSM
jgi:hypothetical protein